jgi:hypothetical protein
MGPDTKTVMNENINLATANSKSEIRDISSRIRKI